ncbi:MAG: class II aldolase/adducin family protein [Promicromonosporaceae bacterium]|nr:class II aldolase/adducin family protein [Promicromonosporaceae bacterium]
MITDRNPVDLNAVLTEMGEAGLRLNAINACEANAGNISVTVPYTEQVVDLFPEVEPYELPTEVSALAGRIVLISGSGQRLREIAADPRAVVGAIVIAPDGLSAVHRYAPQRAFARPTSEANSHLAVHRDHLARAAGHVPVHAVVHAHAPHTTQLTHRGARNTVEFSRQIMRWEPEIVVWVPGGIGFLPFEVPGSKALEVGTVAALRTAEIVAWAKHGVMARSAKGPLGAVDTIEFIETGARFQVTALQTGDTGGGLTDAEIEAIIAAFGVDTPIY